jgi:copper transport protein
LRVLAAIASAFIAILSAGLAASPAFAHATLIASEPADGAMVAAQPAQLTLTFNEPVSALVLRLVSPDGHAQLLANPDGRRATLAIAAPAAMPRGTYALSYRIISLDGHPVGGTVVFSVGAPSGSPPSVPASGEATVVVALWFVKLVLYLGLFVGVGGSAFAAWIDRSGTRPRAVVVSLMAGIVATAAAVGLQGADALGVPLAGLDRAVVWRTGFDTSFGATAVAAALSLAIALLGGAAVSPLVSRVATLLALIGTGVALALSGHASAASPQALMRPAVLVHAIAAACWIGALIPLGAERGLAALLRFSRAIPWAVGALVLSGAALAIVQVERPSALLTTAYGNILCAKLALVVLLLALAARNRFRWTPAVVAGETGARRGLQRAILAELVIAALILGLVSAWRFTPPPRALALAAARPALLHIHTAQAMADVRFEPGHVGIVDASVTIMTGDFGGLDAKEVTLTIANPAAGVEAISRPATKGADAIWRIDRLVIPQGGRWQVRLDILVDDFHKIVLEDGVEVRGP